MPRAISDPSFSTRHRVKNLVSSFLSQEKEKKKETSPRREQILVENRNEIEESERFGNDSVSSNILHVRLFFVPHDSPYFSSNFPVSRRLLLLLLPCLPRVERTRLPKISFRFGYRFRPAEETNPYETNPRASFPLRRNEGKTGVEVDRDGIIIGKACQD